MKPKQAVQIVGRRLICEQSTQQDITHHAHDIGHNVVVKLDIDDASDPFLCLLHITIFVKLACLETWDYLMTSNSTSEGWPSNVQTTT